MDYRFLLLIHILSATIMIGTGLGSAYYLYATYSNKSVRTLAHVLKFVIKADWIFTTPAIVIQFVTGWLLSDILKLLHTDWLILVLFVSGVVMCTWLWAVKLQIEMRDRLKKEGAITARIDAMMRLWVLLGVVAFSGSMYLYYLMVYKPFIN
ncbi:MAG: DUF2269 domain-containing protein [Bacteroidetes bacterium]|nr:DUF2269 domain-containing protein [Bacteroidota bacterium]